MKLKSESILAHNLLIAMPALSDPNFARTVTLICEHSEEGAMGIVVNRLTNLKLRDIVEQIGISADKSMYADTPLYIGGPVQNNRGFVLHEPVGNWEATLSVTDTLGVTSSRDILEAIIANEGPKKFIVVLGYAGWGAGQLEKEITDNAWLNVPATHEILFDLSPENRWKAAARLAGVDISLLSSEAGHA